MWYLFAVSMILALIGFFQSYYQQTEDLELCLNRKLKVLFKTCINYIWLNYKGDSYCFCITVKMINTPIFPVQKAK